VRWLKTGDAKAAAREFVELAGARTMKWGALGLATALAAFVLDLTFAIALQRFLASIDLIPMGKPGLLGPLRSMWLEAVLFLAAGLARVMLMMVNGYATFVCAVTFESNQRREIARWALGYGKASIGEFTTLFNDIVIGSSAVVSNVFYLASRSVLVIATVAALAIYSPAVTALVMLLVVLVMPFHRALDGRLNVAAGVLQRSLAQSVDRLVAGVKNSVFLKIHGLIGQEEQEARALIGSFERSSRAYYSLAAARSAMPQLLGIVVVAGIALGGSAAFGDDKGAIVAYLYLALRLFQSLSEVARVTANTRANLTRYRVLTGWRRTHLQTLTAQAKQAAQMTSAPQPVTGPIGWRLREVGFGWAGAQPLIEGLSLEIPPATATVIVGPSGAGKTSLLLMLAGVLDATAGRIEVVFPDGVEPITEARSRMLPAIAYVGPDPFVVPGTLRQFLLYGLPIEPAQQEITAALKRAHCEFALDMGLDHVLTEQGEGISAGQKQRLSLARALLRRPKVLLLDEPTANLDGEAERVLISTLVGLKGDCTIVAVTHGEALREIADQIVVQYGPAALIEIKPRSLD
jgi:ABC-type multidrug transport system fused ATPase/permease subunit